MPAVTTSFIAAIVDAGLRAIFFAFVVGLGLTMFRVTSVAARSWAWTIVLAAALLMPLLGRAVPTLRWTVPASAAVERFLPVSTFAAPASSPVTDGRAGAPTSRAARSQSDLRGQAMGRADGAAGPASSRAGLRVNWPAFALLVYFCGAIVLLTRAVRGWHATRMLERHAIEVTDRRVVSRLHAHAAALGLTRAPLLSESAALRVPVTGSVMQPRILLPIAWRAWSVERLDAVLVHELSHVARRDTLTQRLSLLYRAVAWFSPLAWWLHHHVADLAEQASDEAALSAGADRTAYAETLLGFFAELRRTPQGAAGHVAMARGAVVKAERRLDRILQWKGEQPMRLTRRLALGLVLAAAPLAALTAAVRLVAAVPPPALAQSMTVTAAAPSVSPAPAARALGAARLAALSVKSPRPKPAPKVSSEPVIPVAQTIYQTGAPGVLPPVAIRHPEPQYTSGGLRAGIQGRVELRAVVLANGRVGDLRITKSLDRNQYGLDEAAVTAAKQWEFRPGTKDGQTVSVSVAMVMTFLKGRSGDQAAVLTGTAADDDFKKDAYPENTPHLVAPKPITQPEPKYTSEAMRAKLQGEVVIEAVIDTDGTVIRARVAQSLDKTYGLDEEALKAAKQWTFEPGTLNGAKVPVIVKCMLAFRLH